VRAAKRRRPRGHIRELPSGTFQVIVCAGTDPLTKKPRYVRETLKTYGAAEVALTRLQGQVSEARCEIVFQIEADVCNSFPRYLASS
jgi:hypothetical protein